MELTDLLQAWPISGPWTVRPQHGGINNLCHFVDTPSGAYVLKLYNPTRTMEKVRFELDVITQLSRMNLSFALPVPVPARSGELIVTTADGTLATLVPLLPGGQPERGNTAPAGPIGAVLGELTGALGRIDVAVPPDLLRTYGDLDVVDGGDPLAVPQRLPLEPAQRSRLVRLVRELQEQIPDAYATLPRQLIHGDFVPFNLLMEGKRVTGVLDFELTTRDLRTLDLASTMYALPYGLWGTGAEWAVLEAHVRGFFSRQALLPAEIASLPFVMRLRRGVTFLHMATRYLAGEFPMEIAVKGAEGALALEDWLDTNSAELVSRMADWAARA